MAAITPTPFIVPTSISEALARAEVAENFFQSALQAQTSIFAVIVAAIVAIGGVLLYFSFRSKIREVVEEEAKPLRKELADLVNSARTESERKTTEQNKTINEAVEKLRGEIHDELRAHERQMEGIKSESYRSLAHFHREREEWDVAFLWYLRAAMACMEGKSSMTATHLGSARKCLKKVKNGDNISSDEYVLADWNTFLSSYSSGNDFATEISLLKTEFESALVRNPPKKE